MLHALIVRPAVPHRAVFWQGGQGAAPVDDRTGVISGVIETPNTTVRNRASDTDIHAACVFDHDATIDHQYLGNLGWPR